jgi:hypothetical protein
MLWLVVGGSLTAVILVGTWAIRTAAVGIVSPAPAGGSETAGHGVPALTGAQPGGREFTSVSDDDYAALTQLLERFFAAQSPAEMLPFVRDAVRVRPMIEAYYREHPFRPTALKMLPGRSDMFAYRNVILGKVGLDNFSQCIVAVEKSPEGFHVDWESYVGWCEVPWERLESTRPIEPVILRARVEDDDYYNHAYADAKRYACYRLSSLDGVHAVYGYLDRRHPLFADLQSRTRLNRLVLATVRIRYPATTGPPNQVEITELVEDGWVLHKGRSSTPADQ